MKKSLVVLFVLLIAALSVMAVSAAYYDQNGNSYWCNKDSYGCWVTGDKGEQIYIMFWSESARDYIMGSGSDAPVFAAPAAGATMEMSAPASASAAESTACPDPGTCFNGWDSEKCACKTEQVTPRRDVTPLQ